MPNAIAVCETCGMPVRVVFDDDGSVVKVLAVCGHPKQSAAVFTTKEQRREMGTTSISAREAHAAVLDGKTVRIVVGDDPNDPVLLHYLDSCFADDHEIMIYTESIGGWSSGVKEAICEPDSDFYIKFVSDPSPLSITIADEEPPQREAPRPVRYGRVRS